MLGQAEAMYPSDFQTNNEVKEDSVGNNFAKPV